LIETERPVRGKGCIRYSYTPILPGHYSNLLVDSQSKGEWHAVLKMPKISGIEVLREIKAEEGP